MGKGEKKTINITDPIWGEIQISEGRFVLEIHSSKHLVRLHFDRHWIGSLSDKFWKVIRTEEACIDGLKRRLHGDKD